jgi:myo-inositol-1(or 4)-monophosphatase
MTTPSPELEIAMVAARKAGALLRENFESDLAVDAMHAHDIKLALDVESQKLIEGCILEAFPDHAIYGEEGIAGNQESDTEWIVDPIDGTVNFFYGIPHFCVSIAMRRAGELKIGAIYDPNLDEMFAVDFEGPATCNGKPIQPSQRCELSDAIVTIGFSKNKESIDAGMEKYRKFAHRVRKTRMMGSAALALAYIACGRLDAYIEEMISIWDIAAGQLLLERGGGKVELTAREGGGDQSSIVSYNGKLSFEDVL